MRNNLLIMVLVVAMALLAVVAYADTTTGTCTASTRERDSYSSITWDWTSNADGGVLGSDPRVSVAGELTRVTFLPDSANATSPTANYDVSILDRDGIDILLGLGANRSQDTAETIFFGMAPGAFGPTSLTQTVNTNCVFVPWRPSTYGELRLKIENAGDANGGKVRLQAKHD